MTEHRPRARIIPVPEDLRSQCVLTRIDYQDALRIDTAQAASRSPEQWARDMFESPPTPVRLMVWYGWKALTAKLGPHPSSAHVLGYTIEEKRADCIRFSVAWALGLSCNLILRTGPSSVTFATFVQHRRRISRMVWLAVVPAHRQITRRLLTRAAGASNSMADDHLATPD